MPKAEKAARKALELDSAFAEAHTALALVNHHYHWKWEAAAGYELAIELNPDHADTHLWYSWLLLALGRRDAAFDEIEQTMSIVREPIRTGSWLSTRRARLLITLAVNTSAPSTNARRPKQLDPEYFMLHFIAGARTCA